MFNWLKDRFKKQQDSDETTVQSFVMFSFDQNNKIYVSAYAHDRSLINAERLGSLLAYINTGSLIEECTDSISTMEDKTFVRQVSSSWINKALEIASLRKVEDNVEDKRPIEPWQVFGEKK